MPSQPSHPWRTLSVLPRPMLRRIATSQTLNYQGRRPAFATTWLPRSHRTLWLPLPAPAPVLGPAPVLAPAPALAPAPPHCRSTHPYTSSLRCRSMQGPRYAMLLHLAMMLSKVSGWGLPSDGKAYDSSHESAITGGVDGARDGRRLACDEGCNHRCDQSWSVSARPMHPSTILPCLPCHYLLACAFLAERFPPAPFCPQ